MPVCVECKRVKLLSVHQIGVNICFKCVKKLHKFSSALKDLTGQIFGEWTVLSLYSTANFKPVEEKSNFTVKK